MVETPKKHNYRLNRRQKAQIVAMDARGVPRVEIARKFDVSPANITNLLRARGKTIEQVEAKLLEKATEQQDRIIKKGYNLLEAKLDEALISKESRKKVKLSEISNALNDIWRQRQVESGNPTDISETYKDIKEIKMYLTNEIQKLEQIDDITLLNEYYNESTTTN